MNTSSTELKRCVLGRRVNLFRFVAYVRRHAWMNLASRNRANRVRRPRVLWSRDFFFTQWSELHYERKTNSGRSSTYAARPSDYNRIGWRNKKKHDERSELFAVAALCWCVLLPLRWPCSFSIRCCFFCCSSTEPVVVVSACRQFSWWRRDSSRRLT